MQLIIKIVNFVPPEARLISFDSIYWRAEKDIPYSTSDRNLKILERGDEIILNAVTDYPLLKHFLEFFEEYFEGGYANPLNRYREFLDWRDRLVGIAKTTTKYAKRKARRKVFKSDWEDSFPNPGHFSITEQGTIDFTDFFSQSLQGCSAERIRICKICDRIFWAARLDKWACSVKCGQVLRTRRKRKKEKKIWETKEVSEQRHIERKKFISKDYNDRN